METKLTVLVDNISSDGLDGEWGLSILVNHAGNQILLDTGGSALFAQNLEKLGYDAAQIDYAVLSHAHYDHANGMPTFFSANKHASFYLRESAGEDCYVKKLFFKKYIGMPTGVLADYADRIQFVAGDYCLCDGAYLIPHKTKGLESIGKKEMMYRKTAKGFVPDDFSHEQSLVLDTEKGLVIINSCSHGGVIQIVDDVKDAFPNKRIFGYVGGLHLFNKSEKEVLAVADAFLDAKIDFVCTGHCTGDRAFELMKERLGGRVSQLHVGLELKF